MFELLKKKLSSFADKIRKKAEGKPGKKPAEEPKRKEPAFVEIPPEKPIEELALPEAERKPPEKVPPKPRAPPERKPRAARPPSELIKKRIRKVREALKRKPIPKEKRPPVRAVPEIPAKKPPEKPEEKPPKPEKPPAKPPEKPPEKPKEKPPEKPEEKLPIKPIEEEFKLEKMSEMLGEAGQPEPLPEEVPRVEAPPEPLPEMPPAPEPKPVEKPAPKPRPAEEEKRELKAKVGALGALKGAIRGYTELKESDITELLFELELSLLEADVNHNTALALIKKIKESLVKERIPRGEKIDEFLKQKIKQALIELTRTEKINLFELIEHSEKPFKVLFLGPNGAGKTTTIAKLSYMLHAQGKTVVWAASDTFRAASIEQLEEHAKKLNIRLVKHGYGADPTAVAFDAVKAAEANNTDVVMIDSAGRQETNRNLIEELKKLERVIKPDLKIFVGEAFAGKNLIEQARAFDEALGLDGFILTKIDTDPKGGTVISLLYELKKPVLFIGTGQKYEDIIPFTPEFIIDRII